MSVHCHVSNNHSESHCMYPPNITKRKTYYFNLFNKTSEDLPLSINQRYKKRFYSTSTTSIIQEKYIGLCFAIILLNESENQLLNNYNHKEKFINK